MTRYRDSVTGRWVSAATWKRSHAHSGTRYKREHRLSRAQFTARGRHEFEKKVDKPVKKLLKEFAATPSRRLRRPAQKAAKRRKAVSKPEKRKSRRRKGRRRGKPSSTKRRVPALEKAPPEKPVETVERRQYKAKGGKIEHIEIIRVGEKIKTVRVGTRSYSRSRDIKALGAILAKSST